jgi:hypothetical protein
MTFDLVKESIDKLIDLQKKADVKFSDKIIEMWIDSIGTSITQGKHMKMISLMCPCGIADISPGDNGCHYDGDSIEELYDEWLCDEGDSEEDNDMQKFMEEACCTNYCVCARHWRLNIYYAIEQLAYPAEQRPLAEYLINMLRAYKGARSKNIE